MEWIKVKVKHAEYEMSTAPDNVFRAWIMVMIYVSATEKFPTRGQLHSRLGEKNIMDLEAWLIDSKTDLDTVINKVLEDVAVTKNKRDHSKAFMLSTRCRKHSDTLPTVPTLREDKIREDKRREEDVGLQPNGTKKPHNDPKLAEMIHSTAEALKTSKGGLSNDILKKESKA